MPISRRDFIHLASRGLLGLSGIMGIAGMIRFMSYEPPPPPPKRYEIGPESDYPLNSRTVVSYIPALIIHNEQGFEAIGMVCTHLGCTVEAKADGFVCPCHGSRYNSEGQVTNGPAQSALATLKIELTKDGKLIVYKG